MGESRVLIWVPAPVDKVRPVLHKAGLGSAVLVAVGSETVVVPSDRTSMSFAAQWAYKARKLAGSAAVFGWNDDAAFAFPVTGPVALGWGWGSDAAKQRLQADLGQYNAVLRALSAFADRFTTSNYKPA